MRGKIIPASVVLVSPPNRMAENSLIKNGSLGSRSRDDHCEQIPNQLEIPHMWGDGGETEAGETTGATEDRGRDPGLFPGSERARPKGDEGQRVGASSARPGPPGVRVPLASGSPRLRVQSASRVPPASGSPRLRVQSASRVPPPPGPVSVRGPASQPAPPQPCSTWGKLRAFGPLNPPTNPALGLHSPAGLRPAVPAPLRLRPTGPAHPLGSSQLSPPPLRLRPTGPAHPLGLACLASPIHSASWSLALPTQLQILILLHSPHVVHLFCDTGPHSASSHRLHSTFPLYWALLGSSNKLHNGITVRPSSPGPFRVWLSAIRPT
jgi:hypothetical protein